MVLLAIAGGGRPYCAQQMAQRVAGLGIPCFSCDPERLPELLERALRGDDLSSFAKAKKGQ